MNALLEALAGNIVITVVGFCFLAVAGMRTVASIFGTVTRERTRREIAAYIAEGSISPEQGERLLKADVNTGGGWTPTKP